MEKNIKNKRKNKSGQEEMVGFALILILVAIIFIVFISIYIRKPQKDVVDYEANSFIQSILQYTTACEEENLENLSVQKLIFKCQEKNPCWNSNRNEDPCRILDETIKGILRESWKVGSDSPIKGHYFIINISEGNVEKEILNLKTGVVTNNYRGSIQDFGKGTEYVKIMFNVYS